MIVKFTLEHGGYVKKDGDIQAIAFCDDYPGVYHGERGFCLETHEHSKACAKVLLDVNPVISPAVEADEDAGIEAQDEVLGLSMRQRAEAWFEQYDQTPDDAGDVELPTKTIKAKNDKGKLVNKEVEDRDLE